MSLREKKYAYTRQALFDSAMELFRQKGYDDVSVEEIAERAGFSRATFFNHFGSKDGVLRHFGDQLRKRVEELVASTEREPDPLDRIRKVLLAMASEVEANRENFRLILNYSSRDPDYLASPTSARKRVIELIAQLVDTAQQSGLARRDMPALEIAGAVFALYQYSLWSIVIKHGQAESAIESVWRFILGGIRGHDPMAQ